MLRLVEEVQGRDEVPDGHPEAGNAYDSDIHEPVENRVRPGLVFKLPAIEWYED